MPRLRRPMSDALDPEKIALLLARCSDGDGDARNHLTPVVYAELKALAANAMRREREGHTLQTTALVNEACLRLLGDTAASVANRAQFAALAAQAMRRVLVDHARRRQAAKRPDPAERIDIVEIDLASDSPDLVDLVELDVALDRLADLSPRQAQVVDLKFFAGLELEQIADMLEVARPTIVRDWRMARAWLQRELA
ncbi:MAG: ECF-type sigma factor [Dokdonella sp.]